MRSLLGWRGWRIVAEWAVRVVIVLAIIASVLWVHLFEFFWGLAFDSHVFLLIGKGIHYGFLPYRDLFEQKPPGIFYYFAAIFSVLPVTLSSVRIADLLLYLCGGAAFYVLCRQEVGRSIALVGTFVWLYLSHHPGFNFNGLHTEEYVSIFAVLAIAAAARYRVSRSPLMAVLSGLAASGALLFKHPGATVVAPALLLIVDRSALKIVPLFLLALVAAPTLAAGYFWHAGALSQFLEANLRNVIAYAHLAASSGGSLSARATQLMLQMGRLLRELPAIAAGLVLAVAACVTRPTRLRVAAVLWLVVDVLAVAAQGRYFQHHFIQTFPAMVFLATIGTAWLLQPRPGERRYRVALRFAVAALVFAVSWPSIRAIYLFRQPTVQQAWKVLLQGPSAWPNQTIGTAEDRMARYIAERTRPEDRIYVAGWGGGLPGVYWAADRFPATRHFFPIMVLGPRPEADRELLADLERNKPTYILLLPEPTYFRPLSALLTEHYTIDKVFYDQYEVWVRNRVEALASGTAEGLAVDAKTGGLVLQPTPAPAPKHAAAETVRAGRWTSPVVPVSSDAGTVLIDWSARSDVARNAIGTGVPIPTTGIGMTVRYRTGPTVDLDTAPWSTVEPPNAHDAGPWLRRAGTPHPPWKAADDPNAPVWVPVEAYVQIRCELWSKDPTLTPVLRYAQIGGVRFAYRDDATQSAAH